MRLLFGLFLSSAATAFLVAPVASQELLSRRGDESQVMSPSTAADEAKVAEIDRLLPWLDSLRARAAIVELHYARLGVPSADGCLFPTDSVADLGRRRSEWSPNAHTRFVVEADGGANIYRYEETILGCSGEGEVTYEYYFQDGRTAFFRRSAVVLEGCPAGPVREVTRYHFDSDDGRLLSKTYSLLDSAGQYSPPDSCNGFLHRPAYAIGRDWGDVLELRMLGLNTPPG